MPILKIFYQYAWNGLLGNFLSQLWSHAYFIKSKTVTIQLFTKQPRQQLSAKHLWPSIIVEIECLFKPRLKADMAQSQRTSRFSLSLATHTFGSGTCHAPRTNVTTSGSPLWWKSVQVKHRSGKASGVYLVEQRGVCTIPSWLVQSRFQTWTNVTRKHEVGFKVLCLVYHSISIRWALQGVDKVYRSERVFLFHSLWGTSSKSSKVISQGGTI